MGLASAPRRFASWLAILAMLAAALAPAITSALAAAHDQHARWTVVCTGDGARLVPVPTDAAGVPVAPGSHAIDPCPFCVPHGASAALPPPPAFALPAVMAGADCVPTLFLHAPRPPFAWAAAQPRAPPAFS
jgi:hypothetical protein